MPGLENSDGLAVTRSAIPGGLRVTLAGELDLLSVPSAVDALRDGHQRAGDVVLDLRELTFMDAAGLAVIVNAGHRARRAGHRFVIHARSPAVLRLLELARAGRTLEIVVDDPGPPSRLPGRFGSYVTRADSCVRLALWGEIDLAARPRLEAEIDELRGSGLASLIVDLRHVSFLDSSGLRLVLELYAAARDDGFELQLVPGPPHVQRVFEITRTLGELPFVPAGIED